MAGFHYRMQNILDMKIQLETQAKIAFAAAQQRLNAEEEKLMALQTRRADYLEEGRRLRTTTLDMLSLKENEQAVKKADEDIKAQILQIHVAQRNLENARKKLQDITVDRKGHEKLKEKAFEEFLEEEKLAEQKQIDELTSYTYGARGSKEN